MYNMNQKDSKQEYLKQTILEMREWNCNKVADLLCDELKELESQ